MDYKSNMRHILEAVWTHVLTEVGGDPAQGFRFPSMESTSCGQRHRVHDVVGNDQAHQCHNNSSDPKHLSRNSSPNESSCPSKKTWKFPNRNPSGKFPTGFFLDIRDLPRELSKVFHRAVTKKIAWPYSALSFCVGPTFFWSDVRERMSLNGRQWPLVRVTE